MEKKYYWLKLPETYLQDPKIKKLRSIAGGDTFTIIYLKMQLLSLKNGGILEFEGIEDDFSEELALKLDERADNVKITLSYLIANKLIESNDNQYLLTEAATRIGSETDSAERVRKFRANSTKSLQCNGNVTKRNANVTLEIDIEKDIEIEKDIHSMPEATSSSAQVTPKKQSKSSPLIEKVKQSSFSQQVKTALLDWLEYKKYKYQDRGFSALLSTVQKNITDYGEDAVISVITESMANCYQGIIWDRLAKKQYGQPKSGNPFLADLQKSLQNGEEPF